MRSTRERVPLGHDVDSWTPVENELYPPPAPKNEGPTSKWYSRGAAGFAAAAPDPTNAQELPRLYIQREDGKGGYNYVPLAERLDIDHLLAALRTHGEEWEHMMPKGDRQTIYKKEPWNHPSQIRIWVKTSVGRLSRGTHHLQEAPTTRATSASVLELSARRNGCLPCRSFSPRCVGYV